MEKRDKYNKEFGKTGESIAASFLIDKGFEIIKKNYRYQNLGEIDIIARKDNLIVFAEVKSRKSDYFGGAIYSISNKKKYTIKKIAGQFLIENPHLNTKEYTFRFDLIAVDNDSVEWIDDIIR